MVKMEIEDNFGGYVLTAGIFPVLFCSCYLESYCILKSNHL